MNNSTWIWIVGAVIVIGGGFFLWQSMSKSADTAANIVDNGAASPAVPAENTTGSGATVDTGVSATVSTSAPTSARVTYNGSSFSPASVTIKKGGTVTFTSTAGNMWVASDEHPTHTEYNGTSRQQHCPDTSRTAFDQCTPGTSYSFTFNKAGTWDYHNHLQASAGGVVKVVE